MIQAKRLSDKGIFNYWVRVRDLASGSVRKLPLTALCNLQSLAHCLHTEFLTMRFNKLVDEANASCAEFGGHEFELQPKYSYQTPSIKTWELQTPNRASH